MLYGQSFLFEFIPGVCLTPVVVFHLRRSSISIVPCALWHHFAHGANFLRAPRIPINTCTPVLVLWYFGLELELELIQTQMAQKPMLRAEVGMRVRCANKASAE